MAGNRRDGDVVRPEAAASGREQAAGPIPTLGGRPLFHGEEQRIPIVEEQVAVGKRQVETGRVRVHTVVDEEKLNLTELLERDVVEIERVPVGREVAQAPLPFEEGDVLVIPVIEERLVVEKRLVVVEEVRIRRRQLREEQSIPVTRRVMHAEIERTAPEAPPPGPPPHTVDPRRSAGPAPFAQAPAAAPFAHASGPSRSGQLHEQSAGRTAAAASGAPRAGVNWTLIGVGLLVLLLLLVIASRG